MRETSQLQLEEMRDVSFILLVSVGLPLWVSYWAFKDVKDGKRLSELERAFSRASVIVSTTFSAQNADLFLLVACWTPISVHG